MTQASAVAEPVYSSLDSDPELGDLVGLFVEEMPGRVETLCDQFNKKDWDNLQRSAHQLKGAAGSYGFGTISPCAGRLEGVIRDGQPEQQIRNAVIELADLCSRARSRQTAT
jgi:histidine phosphotransfer protein HptB